MKLPYEAEVIEPGDQLLVWLEADEVPLVDLDLVDVDRTRPRLVAVVVHHQGELTDLGIRPLGEVEDQMGIRFRYSIADFPNGALTSEAFRA